VEHLIKTDPVMKGLQRGIVNSRALARFIQETAGPESTLDAILGIIRRYPLGNENEGDLHQVFKGCELALRDKMGDLAVENGPDIMKRIAEFASTIRTTRGKTLRVMVGLQSIRVIADQKTLESFRQTLRPKEIISYSSDLTEISVLLPPEAVATKGIIARIPTELAMNDVNLVGIMCNAPEDIVLIAEKDAPRALQALQRVLKEESVDAKRSHTDTGIILTVKNPAPRGRPNPYYATSASRSFQSKTRLGNSHSRTTSQFPLEPGNFHAATSSGLDWQRSFPPVYAQ